MKRKLSFLGVLTLFTFLVGCALFSGNTTTSNITAIPTNPFTTTTSATDGSVASSSDLMSTTTISMTDTTDLQTTTDTTNVLTTNNSDITTTSSERQYTIYFNENKGSEVPDISASAGEAVFEPSSPVREGHTFAGWYLDREYTNPYAFSIMPANNVVLWAKWEADLFTVTFYDADGDVYETQTVAYGQSAILPDDPIRESTEQYDYLFLGWIGNLDGIVKDEAIYPSYQKDLRWYTIVFYALDNVTILEHNSLTYGSTYQTPLLEVSTDDEIFAGWYSGINGSGEKLIESSPVKGDLVWYPHSIENPYLLEDRIAILHELSNQTGATSVDFSTWYNAILNSLGLTTESDEEVLLRLEDGMIRAYVETSGVSVDVIPLIDLLPGRSFAGIDLKIQNMAIGYEDTDGQWQQLMPLSVFHGQPGTSQMYFSADLTHFYWHTIEGREEIMIELASLLPEGYGELTLGYREGFAYLIDADEPREFLEFSMMKGPNFRTQSTMMVCPTYSDRCYITAYFTDGSNSSFTGIEVEFATVQVLDHFGEVISTEKIMLGQSKTMPLPYESEHMTFIGWSESTDVIWKDLVIRPLYQYDTYSLTLVDSLNGTTDILTDLQAEKEHVLPMPSRSGYVFLGWGNDDTSRENLVWPTVSLTEDRVMYAIYALESEYIHQVTFLDKDNKTVLAVVDVMEGKTPVAPTPPVYDGLVFSGWGYWQEAVYEDAIMVARYNSATAISKELLIYKFEKLMYNYEIPGKDEIWAIVTDGTEDLIGLTTIEFPQYIEGHRVYINGPRNYVFVDDKPEISNMYNSVDTVIFPAGVIIASGLEFANNVRKIVFLDGSETTYGNSIYYGVDTVIMEKLPMLFGADGVPDPSLLPFLHTYSVDNLVMHGRIAAPHEDSTATDFFDYYNFNTTDAGFRIFVEAEDLEYYRSLRYWSEIADHVYSMEMLTADFALSLYTDGEVTGWEIVGYLGNDTIVQIPAMIDDLPV
ncbi:MAG: InlB B-repeat-containing protein, partial [Bacilli bacterium]|nr:InlB B-repeat-containing protein [Bacilli bacterium]